MSESKSKIISFRLSAELENLASRAAADAGDKNASAWCQKLVTQTLLKAAEPKGNEIINPPVQPAFVGDLFKAFGNLRQLNLDCFKMSLKNDEQYKEFLNILIASEEEWEAVGQSIGKPTTISPANELVMRGETSGNFLNLNGQEDSPGVQIAAEETSHDYLLFAEELENEIAELIGEREFVSFQNN